MCIALTLVVCSPSSLVVLIAPPPWRRLFCPAPPRPDRALPSRTRGRLYLQYAPPARLHRLHDSKNSAGKIEDAPSYGAPMGCRSPQESSRVGWIEQLQTHHGVRFIGQRAEHCGIPSHYRARESVFSVELSGPSIGWPGWRSLTRPGSLGHNSLISVILKISDPRDWPPLFGSVWDATSVRNFWGGGGPLCSHVKCVSRHWASPRALSLRHGSSETCVVFALSGSVHSLTETVVLRGHCRSGALLFFGIQPLAIAVETLVALLARRTGIHCCDAGRETFRICMDVTVDGLHGAPHSCSPHPGGRDIESYVGVSFVMWVWRVRGYFALHKSVFSDNFPWTNT
ncbi:hypothetical protein FB451DRAFT_1151373 [Mycena latifolia]|nr:hypothetical protein FB451DRAFT_1151373 [Mycena latifolia]